MTVATACFALAVLCMCTAWWLGRARWPRHAPASAIVLWQAVGLTWGIAQIEGLLALALLPYHRGVLRGVVALASDIVAGRLNARLEMAHLAALVVGLGLAAVLVGALAVSCWDVHTARSRHRAVLALVGHGSPRAPGALVLDHPAAAAYCIPGTRSGRSGAVVVSEGTLRLLDRAELSAVLAHEWAHASARHDLVLLPFRALRRVVPPFDAFREAFAAVELLVEMCADDRARTQHSDGPLAGALLRFCGAERVGTPAGGLGAADVDVLPRVRRLLEAPSALPGWQRFTVLATAAVIVTLPAVLAWLP
ncbi:MAG: M56 family metallopeptidase [Sciscionella sp.]